MKNIIKAIAPYITTIGWVLGTPAEKVRLINKCPNNFLQL